MKASLKFRYAVEPRTWAEINLVSTGTREMRLLLNSLEFGPLSKAWIASLKGESLASTVRFMSRLEMLPSSSTLMKYSVAMRVFFTWSTVVEAGAGVVAGGGFVALAGGLVFFAVGVATVAGGVCAAGSVFAGAGVVAGVAAGAATAGAVTVGFTTVGLGSVTAGASVLGGFAVLAVETAWIKLVDSRVLRILSQFSTNRSSVTKERASQSRHPAREPELPDFCDAELRCVVFRGAIQGRY